MSAGGKTRWVRRMALWPVMAAVVGAAGRACAEGDGLLDDVAGAEARVREMLEGGGDGGGGVTRVRIEGLSHRHQAQVLALIGGRLTQIRAKPATPARADDAAFLLKQLLNQDGRANARVTWRIAGVHEIILKAENAARLSLSGVTVVGAAEGDVKRLVRLFEAPAVKDLPPGFSSPPFREEDVGTGLSYLVQDYQARGYWAATAVEEKRDVDPATGDVSLVVRVEPGVMHLLGKPVIEPGDGQVVGHVSRVADNYVGKVANTAHLNAMRAGVEDSFRSAGFPDVRVAMAGDAADGRFVPQFRITQGEQVRLRTIRAVGFDKTHPERVERRLKDMEGGWYDTKTLNQRMREFLATGAFTSVRVETEEVGEGVVDATLHFEEGKAREFTFSAGAGSYSGPILRFLYGNRNIGGRMQGLSTGLEFSTRGLLGDVRLTDPWLFGSDYAGTLRGYSVIYGHEGYTSFDTGVEAIVSRKFSPHFRAELMGGTSIVNNNEDGLPSYALGDNAYSHTRVRLTPVWDYRDSPVLATSGWTLRTPVQMGTVLGEEQAAYLSLAANGGWYHRLGESWQMVLGGQVAALIPTGDVVDFPIDLRYFNGGANTVRSFPERELGPSINRYATGGNAMWSANAEFIRPLIGPAKWVGFVDAGALSLDYADIFSADFEMAVGMGLRLELPIGPVRFEYGYNVTRDPGEPNGAFHFAIGTTF